MLRGWSHDFAGYVINIVGLEDIGCREYLFISAEIFENGVWKSAEQIPLRVLRWFSQS